MTPSAQTMDLIPLPGSLTSLVGRERDLERLTLLLRRPEVRMVTVTGAGGVGKTRLGLATAAHVGADFADGVAFVSLGPVGNAGLVIQTVAAALGLGNVSGDDALGRVLSGREVLLVLDNFEHLIGAASAIAALLTACPGVKALVTSRERLRVRGEREVPLSPLRVPPTTPVATEGDVANLLAIPAVALFVERIKDVRPEFALRPDNATAAVEICRRLDGLPLALELCAARAKVLPLPALLTRLDRRLPLLTEGPRDQPARQQTLERTIAWSYDLLSPEEQAIFRRFTVFTGGFTLDAAEAVGGGVDAIGSLVDKSILRQEEGFNGEARFVFLETIREFGLERLVERGEADTARAVHARWVRGFVESTWNDHWGTPIRQSLVDQFDLELGNLRAALEWMAATEDATGLLSLTGLLASYWIIRSHRAEGRSWSERGLAMTGAGEVAPEILARACYAAAALARTHGDRERAIALTQRCHAMYARLGDAVGVAASVNMLGALERGRGNLDPAADHFEDAVARFAILPMTNWLGLARCNLGMIRLWQGNLAEARLLLESALAGYLAHDDAFGVAFTQWGLAFVTGDSGDVAAAAGILVDVVERSSDAGWNEILIDALFGTGVLAVTARDWAGAAQTLAAAAANAEAIGYAIDAPE